MLVYVLTLSMGYVVVILSHEDVREGRLKGRFENSPRNAIALHVMDNHNHF